MSSCLIVKKSPIRGRGVFTLCNFKAGEVVNKWDKSTILKKNELNKLSKKERKHISYIGNGQFVLLKSPEKYINHSCNPNTYVKDCTEVAIKDINAKEEITCDYSLEGVNEWKFECHCGSKNCRRIIYGDFKKLDSNKQNLLMPFVQDWYVKEIMKKK